MVEKKSLYFINSIFFDFYLEKLFYLFCFFVISLLLAIIIRVLAQLVGRPRKFTLHEGSTSYECGFEPFSDSRSSFDVRFYLVAIIFIIFDLEVVLLYPWILNLQILGFFVFSIIIFFLLILVVGFIYEWGKGALDW